MLTSLTKTRKREDHICKCGLLVSGEWEYCSSAEQRGRGPTCVPIKGSVKVPLGLVQGSAWARQPGRLTEPVMSLRSQLKFMI